MVIGFNFFPEKALSLMFKRIQRDCLQILLPIFTDFTRINQLIFTLKEYFSGNTT